MTLIRFLFLGLTMLILVLARQDTLERDGPEGLLAMYALAALFLLLSVFPQTFLQMWSYPLGKLMLLPAAFLFLYLLAIAVIIIYGLCNRSSGKEKTMIVPGTKIIGGQPSKLLCGRLDAAAEFLSANTEARCIVSGGPVPGEDLTEASVMAAYLVDRGIDAKRILCEQASPTTYHNLKYSMTILRNNGIDIAQPIAVCTDLFHFARCCWHAGKLGYGKLRLVPSKNSPFHTAGWFFREIMVYVKLSIDKPE